MTGIMKLNIGGQERTLRFNNFSAIELSRIIYNGEQANFETEDLLDRIMKLNEKNHYLLVKTLVYAGIIGNDYVVGFNARDFKTVLPNVDIRWGGNFTGPRRGRSKMMTLEPWGTMEHIMVK